jgi:hypothetical protein
MRNVETRIKVVTIGDTIKYHPQIKGHNLDRFDPPTLFIDFYEKRSI